MHTETEPKTSRIKRTWIFEVQEPGKADPYLTTSYWGFEDAARRRVAELKAQMDRMRPGCKVVMFAKGDDRSPGQLGRFALSDKKIARRL